MQVIVQLKFNGKTFTKTVNAATPRDAIKKVKATVKTGCYDFRA